MNKDKIVNEPVHLGDENNITCVSMGNPLRCIYGWHWQSWHWKDWSYVWKTINSSGELMQLLQFLTTIQSRWEYGREVQAKHGLAVQALVCGSCCGLWNGFCKRATILKSSSRAVTLQSSITQTKPYIWQVTPKKYLVGWRDWGIIYG